MQPGKNATIKDVAEHCGLSKSLVGYILSNSPVRRGSDETRARVHQAARELGYRPNRAAKMLVGKSSRIIGVSIDSYSAPVHFRRLTLMEREAKLRGYRLMINENSDGPDELLEAYHTFCEYGVNGVIYLKHDFPCRNHKLQEYFQGIDNVVFSGKPACDPACYIDIDWAGGTREAALHFFRSGRKRPALIVDRLPFQSIESRVEGFRQAMAEAGRRDGADAFVFRIKYFYSNDELRRGSPRSFGEFIRRVIDELILPHRIDAVIIQNDFYAAMLLQQLDHLGIRVPEEIAVIGYDDDPFAEALIPPLASVSENIELQAVSIVELMIRVIENGVPPPEQRVTRVPATLILRDSAGERRESE